MQYHEVKVNIEFRDVSDCCWHAECPQAYNANNILTPTTWAAATNWNTIYNAANNIGDFTASLWVDYIYLDTDERRRFAQVSHEYLLQNKRSKATTRKHADTVCAQMCRHSVRLETVLYRPFQAQMVVCCC